MIADLYTIVLVSAGCLFFLAGTLGLLRFPDVYSRLHALTKADNLGLGLIVLGLIPQVAGWGAVFKLLAVWALALLAAASAAHVVARAALAHGVPAWRRR